MDEMETQPMDDHEIEIPNLTKEQLWLGFHSLFTIKCVQWGHGLS